MKRINTLCLVALLVVTREPRLFAQGPTAAEVLRSIDRAKRYLKGEQRPGGSWLPERRVGIGGKHEIGSTALVTLALLNAGMTQDDKEIEKALDFLRKNERRLVYTYDISLVVMALATAKAGANGKKDVLIIRRLAKKLERLQLTKGPQAGLWDYKSTRVLGGDESNGQFAILALREAAHYGVPVERNVWVRARRYWENNQKANGGWGYRGSRTTGSMTVAGIATLTICESMLSDGKDLKADGSLNCCEVSKPNKKLEAGGKWLAANLSFGANPGVGGPRGMWVLYFKYGLERAGRFTGKRFFGKHDWYRGGARWLIKTQNKREGWWPLTGFGGIARGHEVIGTSFALLFLSKGLSPVMVNKLEYGTEADWNRNRDDARHMTDYLSGQERWPKLMTWQTANLAKALQQEGEKKGTGLESLMQAPVLLITGKDAPAWGDRGRALLREFVGQGGFILAVGGCSKEFEVGFREQVKKMYEKEKIEIKPLSETHEIFRAEHRLDPKKTPLEGADFGCRTAIVLAPEKMNLGCLWQKWRAQHPPKRLPRVVTMIDHGMKVGTNILAYATGREPPIKLSPKLKPVLADEKDRIARGLVQIAKIKHDGGWDTAPRATKMLLTALNQQFGTTAKTDRRELFANDKNLFRYPIAYMHGRGNFELKEDARLRLKMYLDRGGVLFADACCASKEFDKAFRKLVEKLYPGKLKRIPVSEKVAETHEMLLAKNGYDLRKVRRRGADGKTKLVPPFLEGVEVKGRLAIIYSKYDISCALQRQGSVACSGYSPDDATKIAINVVIFAMQQDVEWREVIRNGGIRRKEPVKNEPEL